MDPSLSALQQRNYIIPNFSTKKGIYISICILGIIIGGIIFVYSLNTPGKITINYHSDQCKIINYTIQYAKDCNNHDDFNCCRFYYKVNTKSFKNVGAIIDFHIWNNCNHNSLIKEHFEIGKTYPCMSPKYPQNFSIDYIEEHNLIILKENTLQENNQFLATITMSILLMILFLSLLIVSIYKRY